MSDWNSFLLTQTPIKITPNTPEWSPETTYLMPLPHQGLLSICGPDAIKFLQGQVTCDVRELEHQQTRLGAQCNIKGRMLLCFRALQINAEQILLRMHYDLVSNGLTSLGKYSVFSKVKLANVSDDYRSLAIVGNHAHLIIAQTLGITISDDGDWQLAGNNLVIRIDQYRYECWLAANEAETIWLALASHCQITTSNFWELWNIQAGLGDITPETIEAFTPQTINLQLVNGINFRKGCYTGQEIVARLHYRGNLKRHMYRFEFELSDLIPRPGSALHNSSGKVVGDVVLATEKNTTCGELLASVLDDQCNDLFLPNRPQKLRPLPLPYAIPTADDAD